MGVSLSMVVLWSLLYGLAPQPTTLTPSSVSLPQFGFEPNMGQISTVDGHSASEVLARIKLPNYAIFLTTQGVSHIFYRREDSGVRSNTGNLHLSSLQRVRESEKRSKTRFQRFDLRLVQATITRAQLEFEDPFPGYVNYYRPTCPQGVEFMKTYRTLRIRNVWPGIDWAWRIKDGKVHNEFILHPGAHPEDIQFEVHWADLMVSEDGHSLVFQTPMVRLSDGRLVANEDNQPVEARYRLEGNMVTLEVEGWSGQAPLVIDPPLTLAWATYFGGSDQDNAYGIAVDNEGNLLVSGRTESYDFPTYDPGGGAYYDGVINGGEDLFLLKFSNDGVLEWATYFGGNDDEGGFRPQLTVDADGNVYMTGSTYSVNFPTMNPGGGTFYQGSYAGSRDAFITKFNPQGVLVWSTYYGGSNGDTGHGVGVDPFGNLIMVGFTNSPDLPLQDPGGGAYYDPTFNGGKDGFLVKFSPSGELIWGTYYGGTGDDYDYWDAFYSVDADTAGNIFVTGYAGSLDFPTLNPGGNAYYQGSNAGGYDAFMVKFDAGGVRQWATYFGGNSDEDGMSLKVGPNGHVFLIGYTMSTTLPTQDPGGGAYFQGTLNGAPYEDAYIVEFSNDGELLWSTYYGGISADDAYHLDVDASGTLYVTGATWSPDLPVYDPGDGSYFDNTFNSGYQPDAFIAKFGVNRSLQWATYFGGDTGFEEGDVLAADANGNLFVVGTGNSDDMPTVNPGGDVYFQGTHVGLYDLFILKFGEITSIGESEARASSRRPYHVPTLFQNRLPITFMTPLNASITVTLYNVMGQVILSRTFQNTSSVVLSGTQIERLPRGSYFLKVDTDTKTFTPIQVIKE